MYSISYPNDIEIYKEDVLSRIEDAFTNIEFIASSESGVDKIQEEIFDSSESYHQERISYTTAHTKTQGAGYLAGTLFYLGTIQYMYKLNQKGEIKDESFQAYLLVLGKFYGIVFDLAYLLPQTVKIYKTMGSTKGFLRSIYRDYELRDDIDIPNGSIQFNNVDFSHGNAPKSADPKIIDNYSISIPSGTKVCLFGNSGSGKSTFVGLVKGNFVASNGTITIGGIDNSRVSRKILHSTISMVNQNTNGLLKRSVYKNMIFGLEDTPELRIKLEKIIMHYNINKVFNQPCTAFLDDECPKLSGGQRQIVHLVHAFLQPNTKILILDEPTSALDCNVRDNILNMIDELNEQRGITVLHISHDPHVKSRCDITIDFPL
jgi:ABC-type bacteriocin/lantibiotic exporter with double-glycine peptidase domain